MKRSRRSRQLQAAARRRRLLLWLAMFAVVVLLVLLFDLDWFKGPIERRVQQATGRDFAIEGNLDGRLGWPPWIIAERVRLANADWADSANMLEVERLELQVNPWAAWRGRWELPAARLQAPRLRIERNAERASNWDIFGERSEQPSQLVIGQVMVSDGTVRIEDLPTRTAVTLTFDSGEPGARHLDPPLLVGGKGRWRGQDFSLTGLVESPDKLRDRERPYHVDLKLRAGRTRIHAHGEIMAQLQLDRFDLNFELSGDDLEDLYRLFDVALPSTPPYTLDGRLSRDGPRWSYRDFSGTLGDSDLSGDARIDFSGERPAFRAELASKRLDFDDLAPLVGGAPDPEETASEAQQRIAAEREASGRLLPDRPYDLDKLRAMDADVSLKASSIDAGRLPIDALDARLKIEGGRLTLDPLLFGIAGGRLDARVWMDAGRDPMAVRMVGSVHGLELPKLFPESELAADAQGRVGGRLEVDGLGNSMAAVLAGGNGEVSLVMGRGQVSNLLLELAGLDFAEALLLLLGSDRLVAIRCAFADFELQDGVLASRTIAFDTTDTLLLGHGTVDLGSERFDLELQPRPKDRSIFALRSPLKVGGTLKEPQVGPKAGPLALRGAAAAVLSAIAPPAALLALIETGPGEDVDCAGIAGAVAKGEPAQAKDVEPKREATRQGGEEKAPSNRRRRD
jgi:AsmA family protein